MTTRAVLPAPVAAALVASVALLVAVTTVPIVGAERHVAAASGHVCVVTPSYNVTCLGDDFSVYSNKTAVPAGASFVAVTAGDTFSCGLDVDGKVACWGEFPGGAPPDSSTTFIDIHAGARNLCGLQKGGAVLCYGYAAAGVNTVPYGDFQGVSTGTDVACGVRRNKYVTCWGSAANPIIAALPVIRNADHVSVGARHACYVNTTGGVACWGDNTFGQASVPADINAASAVWWLSAGSRSTCVLSGADAANLAPPGRLTCWGESTGNVTGRGAYEVACSSWGCIMSEDAGNGAANTSFVVTSMLGVPIPRTYNMTRWLGSGTSGYAAGAGTNAQFNLPAASPLQGGIMAIADYFNQLVRRVNISTAVVTTLAGQRGLAGNVNSTDPLAAKFSSPHAIVYGVDGNLYVYDAGTHLIRQITPAGVVSTVAGREGVGSPWADGAGTNAVLGDINDMRYDATTGIVFLADYNAYRVRALYPNMTVGTIAQPWNQPTALALDPLQRVIYVGTLTVINRMTYGGTVTWFSGDNTAFADGPATVARFAGVYGMELDSGGNLYVTDMNNHRIRRVSPTGAAVTLLGTAVNANVDGVGTNAQMGNIMSIRADATGTILQ